MDTKQWTLNRIKETRLLYMKAFYYKLEDQRSLLEYELNMLAEILRTLEDD
jgi:hypothetical protein